MQDERYLRQTILPEVGPLGQQKLFNSRVLCVGAGGLGCPILLYLAAAGIGKIGIIDFDHVELSNLARQVLFTEKDIGRLKVIAAKEKLMQLNSNCEISTYQQRLTLDNV